MSQLKEVAGRDSQCGDATLENGKCTGNCTLGLGIELEHRLKDLLEVPREKHDFEM